MAFFNKRAETQFKHGVYHYLKEAGTNKKRLHLRMEADGHGTLLVNACRIFHFNPTAALMAYLILEGSEENEIITAITNKFQVEKQQAESDLRYFRNQFDAITSPKIDLCPICDLELETYAPFSQQPSAPYRMDLAITYRCNCNCSHCYNARPRSYPEMESHQWQEIIERLWEIGIPHIVFTGGEPTLRADLPELIHYAEKTGLITGLNTNGRKLKDKKYTEDLVEAGLDHIQVTLESHDNAIHDAIVASPGAWQETVTGIKNALETNLFVMTNTTLLKQNSIFLSKTLNYLAKIGIPTIGLNGLIYSGRGKSCGEGIDESQLPELLNIARDLTSKHNQRLIWYTPTQYCHFDPVAMGLGVKGCTAALYNMCIEPDGGVIPCQSYYQSLGNILTDEWNDIWTHDLAVSIREKRYLPEDCRSCALLKECGGGCPLTWKIHTDVHPEKVLEIT
ncbi:MAG TPA: radical SAM protein [Anaerolineae bacterium]|nr:radical SAM protein [Anaerolineae bacterium]